MNKILTIITFTVLLCLFSNGCYPQKQTIPAVTMTMPEVLAYVEKKVNNSAPYIYLGEGKMRTQEVFHAQSARQINQEELIRGHYYQAGQWLIEGQLYYMTEQLKGEEWVFLSQTNPTFARYRFDEAMDKVELVN